MAIVGLSDAKDFLNITSGDSDAELASFIDAASAMWTSKVGPVTSQSYDEYYDGGAVGIVLTAAPVLTITSVVESYGGQTTYTLTEQPVDGGVTGTYGYTIEKASGLLVRRAAGVAVSFPPGTRNVHVVYTSGYGVVPDDIHHGVLLLVKHMWETQRGSGRRPGQGGDDYAQGLSYAWPRRAEEIAQAYYIPGIA